MIVAAKPDVRRGMPSVELSRAEFETRYRTRFTDPAFAPLKKEIDAITAVAWDGYIEGRKSPATRKAGPGFADPDYDLSVDWIDARSAIDAAQAAHEKPGATPRILIVNGSSRSEHTCPGEMSKTWRLIETAKAVFEDRRMDVEVLNLSRLTSEFGKIIHPCKACVSTAMPLCHWPCSCYPNHSLGQIDDWMADIYPMWVAAHGIMIVTPVNWYHAPTGLKAMIDRLVCADGGNPDPTTTHGKKPDEAKALELKGWPYPRHLKGRYYSVIAHGDVTGAETLRRSLSDWLTDIGLISAGGLGERDGYIGYDETYATSHQALDDDEDFQENVRNAARTLANAITLSRAGKLQQPDAQLREPNPK